MMDIEGALCASGAIETDFPSSFSSVHAPSKSRGTSAWTSGGTFTTAGTFASAGGAVLAPTGGAFSASRGVEGAAVVGPDVPGPDVLGSGAHAASAVATAMIAGAASGVQCIAGAYRAASDASDEQSDFKRAARPIEANTRHRSSVRVALLRTRLGTRVVSADHESKAHS